MKKYQKCQTFRFQILPMSSKSKIAKGVSRSLEIPSRSLTFTTPTISRSLPPPRISRDPPLPPTPDSPPDPPRETFISRNLHIRHIRDFRPLPLQKPGSIGLRTTHRPLREENGRSRLREGEWGRKLPSPRKNRHRGHPSTHIHLNRIQDGLNRHQRRSPIHHYFISFRNTTLTRQMSECSSVRCFFSLENGLSFHFVGVELETFLSWTFSF